MKHTNFHNMSKLMVPTHHSQTDFINNNLTISLDEPSVRATQIKNTYFYYQKLHV